ncbi:hypothetical protein TNIN_35471 [Trichonephila inaurata madagascariensis]|uniref:Uncharacterized protein n=1 Tax=Trichonephila inaurata madagascariensis TaxID=2747483 RepID=A0A8X6XD88_9ARAC|nr:hypothetical protein TNIN_35471 [Trichonephila inaurata madagascariensis]
MYANTSVNPQKRLIMEPQRKVVEESADSSKGTGKEEVKELVKFAFLGFNAKPNFCRDGKQKFYAPIYMLVRPRPGNFVYSNDEKDTMKKGIEFGIHLKNISETI